jgi:hypothetical protein
MEPGELAGIAQKIIISKPVQMALMDFGIKPASKFTTAVALHQIQPDMDSILSKFEVHTSSFQFIPKTTTMEKEPGRAGGIITAKRDQREKR